MPKIKLDHIVSFSSEDPAFPANNLLDPDPAKKWKCKTKGEKQAFVILQLEKASVISGIDIGNEHSSYVEVLVARSNGSKDSDFKVLLVMSSFMTSLESRQSTNINKVRMFKTEELSAPERDEKWDRIKIVCTQPFNRHVQYGLSFITFHSPECKEPQPKVQQTIGKFVLRPPSPDDIAVGSTFFKKKETTLSAAAAIRDASTSLLSFKPKQLNTNKTQQTTTEIITAKNRNRDDILYNKDEEQSNENLDMILNEIKRENEKKTKEEEKEKKKQKTASKRPSENENNNSSKRKKVKEKVTKPFNKLLEGVTLVISGIKNPDRTELRTKALQMGAKYKPDWDDNSCTHLICAFENTPKFNQVKSKGKIVTKKWIEACYSQRKRLPWRRFALCKQDLDKAESEDEILEQVTTESDTDEDVVTELDGPDTEDEIERIQALQQKKQEEEPEDLLGNFFHNKTIYLDTVLDYKDRELLSRYIIAYDGNLTKEPKEATIIISNEDNIDVVRNICGEEILCLTPNWVFECHNNQKLVPFDNFKLINSLRNFPLTLQLR